MGGHVSAQLAKAREVPVADAAQEFLALEFEGMYAQVEVEVDFSVVDVVQMFGGILDVFECLSACSAAEVRAVGFEVALVWAVRERGLHFERLVLRVHMLAELRRFGVRFAAVHAH